MLKKLLTIKTRTQRLYPNPKGLWLIVVPLSKGINSVFFI